MGSTDVDGDWDDLTGGEGLDVLGVVLELEALALPDVAGSRVEIVLAVGNL